MKVISPHCVTVMVLRLNPAPLLTVHLLLYRATLNTRRQWCRCFQLTIAANDRDKLMNEEIWPRGFYVQKYFSPRRSAVGSQMNQY